MKKLTTINPENASEEEVKNYRVREAARAVVFDKDGKVALLHVSKKNYYKLPGVGNSIKRDFSGFTEPLFCIDTKLKKVYNYRL